MNTHLLRLCKSAAVLGCLLLVSINAPTSTLAWVSANNPCAGTYVLCDDFGGSSLDTGKWTVGNLNVANKYPVRPENISLAMYNDNGTRISVVDSKAFGALHASAPKQGGVIMSRKQLAGGRYEVRMKTLPGPHGCSCIWNYYDSLNEARPPVTRVYTEIDIELPAHLTPAPVWAKWKRTLGFNTWSRTDADSDATYINHASTTVNPFDGQFHVYRWDWFGGKNGKLRIDWSVDGVLQTTTSHHVGTHPAPLWIGNWPAPWPGMDYAFDTAHLYIDWVRVSAL